MDARHASCHFQLMSSEFVMRHISPYAAETLRACAAHPAVSSNDRWAPERLLKITTISTALKTSSDVEAIAEIECALAFFIAVDREKYTTMVSHVRAALRGAGYSIRDGRGRDPLRQPWQDCIDLHWQTLTDNKTKLLRSFAYLANEHGYQPSTITNQVFEQLSRGFIDKRDARSAARTIKTIAGILQSIGMISDVTGVGRRMTKAERGFIKNADAELPHSLQDGLSDLRDELTATPHKRKPRTDQQVEVVLNDVRRHIALLFQQTGTHPPSIDAALGAELVAISLRAQIGRARRRTGNSELKSSSGAYNAICNLCQVAQLRFDAKHPNLIALEELRAKLNPKRKVRSPDDAQLRPKWSQRSTAPKRLARRREDLVNKLAVPATAELYLKVAIEAFEVAETRGDQRGLAELRNATVILLLQKTGAPLPVIASLDRHAIVFADDPACVAQVTIVEARGARLVTSPIMIDGPAAEKIRRYIDHVRPRRPGASATALFPGHGGAHISVAALSAGIRAFFRARGLDAAPRYIADNVAFIAGVHTGTSDAQIQRFRRHRVVGSDPFLQNIRVQRIRNSRHP
jgi:hypothetical protein